MRPHARILLLAAASALSLSGAAHAYTVVERNDTSNGDPSEDYGDVSGTCNNGTGFTIRYQTDHRGRLYFEDLENQGPDEDAVIRQACGE